MAESGLYTFDYREVVEALLRKQGISQGLWTIHVEFAMTVANIETPFTAGTTPAAIVPLTKIGIRKVSQQDDLTVDAATLGVPAQAKTSSKSKSSRKS